MRFTHNETLYELDESSITFAEAEAVEAICELPFNMVGAQVVIGALRPQRAFAWLAMKRVNPLITIDELAAFPIESIVWKKDSSEGESDDPKDQTLSSDLSDESQP